MEKVSIDNKAKLSEHFTLCEMTKTKHVTKDGNIPSLQTYAVRIRYSYLDMQSS